MLNAEFQMLNIALYASQN